MYQFAPSRKENEKRFQRRHLLRLLSFAFRVESCLEPEPTRHSGTDNHPDKSLLLPRGRLLGMASQAERQWKKSGIGGLFFRAHDPTALGHWYQQHLGVHSLIPTAGSRACTTRKEILSNCGNLRDQPLARLLRSSGLFLDLSWLGGQPFKSPAMPGVPDSAFAIYYCSAAHQLLQFFGVTSPLHRDP